MITKAKFIHHQAVQGYELQAIVGFNSPTPRWFEILYRPTGSEQVEALFAQMTDHEKIEFDTNLFTLIPAIQSKHGVLNFSVNLSPLSLSNPKFLLAFDQLISSQAIDCTRLCIEIVESDILLPLNIQALKALKKFKSRGGQVALDDFGAGHTHWELLQLGLVDIIKVASQKIENKQENKLFEAMASFSNKLGLDCVMEGVENKSEYEFAKQIGFDFCQGWFFNSWKQSI